MIQPEDAEDHLKVLSDSEDMDHILPDSDNESILEQVLKDTKEKVTAGSAQTKKTKPKITLTQKTKDQTVVPNQLPF